MRRWKRFGAASVTLLSFHARGGDSITCSTSGSTTVFNAKIIEFVQCIVAPIEQMITRHETTVFVFMHDLSSKFRQKIPIIRGDSPNISGILKQCRVMYAAWINFLPSPLNPCVVHSVFGTNPAPVQSAVLDYLEPLIWLHEGEHFINQ
jgi:hypothetical protein